MIPGFASITSLSFSPGPVGIVIGDSGGAEGKAAAAALSQSGVSFEAMCDLSEPDLKARVTTLPHTRKRRPPRDAAVAMKVVRGAQRTRVGLQAAFGEWGVAKFSTCTRVRLCDVLSGSCR